MPTTVLVLPILPDKEEGWRRFAQDLLGDRIGEYETFRIRLGVGGVRAYLARFSRREVILVYVEARAPEAALRQLLASEEPFDKWFKEKLEELHGYDLKPRGAGASPELVFEYPRDLGPASPERENRS